MRSAWWFAALGTGVPAIAVADGLDDPPEWFGEPVGLEVGPSEEVLPEEDDQSNTGEAPPPAEKSVEVESELSSRPVEPYVLERDVSGPRGFWSLVRHRARAAHERRHPSDGGAS